MRVKNVGRAVLAAAVLCAFSKPTSFLWFGGQAAFESGRRLEPSWLDWLNHRSSLLAQDRVQGFGPPNIGPGGFGPPGATERKLLKQFDVNLDGWLNREERTAAREFLRKNPGPGPGGPGGFGPPGGMRGGPGGVFAGALMQALDGNKDSKLSSKEAIDGAKKFFALALGDKKEAEVNESDVAAVINRLLPPPPGVPSIPGFGPGTFMGPALAKRADKNSDGKLTEAEFVSATDTVFKEADKNADSQLDQDELVAAIGIAVPPPQFGPGGGRSGGPGGGPGGGPFGRSEPGKPGPKVAIDDVRPQPEGALYDPRVLRTLFFEFEETDWEAELQEFHNTDIDVPAVLVVDGKKYEPVGMRFRGMSSYGMVPAGSKRSFNVSLDRTNSKQRLGEYKTLNLLNSHEDGSFLSTVLYSRIARRHIAAPQANLVKVVINGESWGVYVNTQQFNKDFLAENYPSSKGTRWKVPGSPGASGGLEYFGENIEDYKRRFEMKSNDGDKEWQSLIKLCRVLNETKPEELEAALQPMLDIDEVLWFLALEVALINNDGYWVRASDYSIYLDPQGVFHILPHDMNEALHGQMMFGPPGMGPGGPGGGFFGGLFGGGGPRPGQPGGDRPNAEPRPSDPRPDERREGIRPDGDRRGGDQPGGANSRRSGPAELDPLIALDDPRKPLRSKLLAVPKLREQYLRHLRTIAEEDLDWHFLGPIVADLRELIGEEIKADTRKLSSYEEFMRVTANDSAPQGNETSGRGMSLRAFADQRRAYLRNHPEIKKLTK